MRALSAIREGNEISPQLLSSKLDERHEALHGLRGCHPTTQTSQVKQTTPNQRWPESIGYQKENIHTESKTSQEAIERSVYNLKLMNCFHREGFVHLQLQQSCKLPRQRRTLKVHIHLGPIIRVKELLVDLSVESLDGCGRLEGKLVSTTEDIVQISCTLLKHLLKVVKKRRIYTDVVGAVHAEKDLCNEAVPVSHRL